MTLVNVETIAQLKDLFDASALTWEGLVEEDFELALDMCSKSGKDGTGYVIKGSLMNNLCRLTGSNRYPDDLTIFAIKDFKVLALAVGAKWMDDIIDNNAQRECAKEGVNFHLLF